jgi:RNA polymerase sigma factor (sigma-70 family)
MDILQALESPAPDSAPPSAVAPEMRTGGQPDPDWESLVRSRGRLLRVRVWRALMRLGLGSRLDLAEELLQEVYCRLFEDAAARLRRCRGYRVGSIDSYLGMIAERTVYDHVRVTSALKRSGVEVVQRSRRRLEEVPDPGENPERRLLRREEFGLFLDRCRTLRGLGSGRRNAWVLRLALIQGFSSREIARAAGGRMTPRAVDLLISRIRRRLARDGFALPHR